MTTLKIIVASTRPGSIGPAIGDWVAGDRPGAPDDFDRVEMLDLAEINLPFLDEPHHPKLGRYTKPHTLAWSHDDRHRRRAGDHHARIQLRLPGAAEERLDFLHAEWPNKALGMVSYGGGLSGGARAGRDAACRSPAARPGHGRAHGGDSARGRAGGRR